MDKFEASLQSWTSSSLGRREFLASLGILLASCASVDKTRRLREGDNSGQEIALTPEDEKKLTAQVLSQMQKDYPPHPDIRLQKYVAALGSKIVQANGLEGNPYKYSFTVTANPVVNAFALPAGTVFVTAPLLAMADSEAELAGVIGHEVGHIKARHSAERMEVARREQSSSWKYALGGGLLGGLLGYGLGRLACRSGDNECLSSATQLGAAAGAGGGLLVQKYAFMANSREDEMEADRIGYRTSVTAGYHKHHVGLFYEKLLKMEESRKNVNPQVLQSFADALSTHPPTKERVQQMHELARSSPAPARAVISTSDFTEIRKLAQQTPNKV
ncbi:MAG: M48 family metalloprotease [Bdellovibrio sp.]